MVASKMNQLKLKFVKKFFLITSSSPELYCTKKKVKSMMHVVKIITKLKKEKNTPVQLEKIYRGNKHHGFSDPPR